MQITERELKGLMFRTSEAKKVTKDGEKKTRYFPIERPLRPGDILSATETKGKTVIVTKDGQKYVLGQIATAQPKTAPAAKNAGGDDKADPKKRPGLL